MTRTGVQPELLLNGKYGHALHVWDLRKRRHHQTLDLGPQYQMALELRPAHDPTKAYGFAGVVVSTADLSASIWLWNWKSATATAWGMEGAQGHRHPCRAGRPRAPAPLLRDSRPCRPW